MTDNDALEIFRPFVIKHAKEVGIITNDVTYTILAKCHHRGHYINIIVQSPSGKFTAYEYRFSLHNQPKTSKSFPQSSSHIDDSIQVHLPVGQIKRLA